MKGAKMKKCRCDKCKKARTEAFIEARRSLIDLLEHAQATRLRIREHKEAEKKLRREKRSTSKVVGVGQ